MAGKQPVPEETRRAVLRMRAGGADYDEIARVLKVSKGWISTFLKRRDEELAELRGQDAPEQSRAAIAARTADAVETEGKAPPEPTPTTDDNIAALQRELSKLRRVADQTTDPIERSRMSTAIATVTSKLAALRREEARAKPVEEDLTTKRAADAAAASFRKLLEEALAEEPEDVVP